MNLILFEPLILPTSTDLRNKASLGFRMKFPILVTVIRPGCSRLLEFEKKIVLVGLFPNIQTRPFNRDQKLAVAAVK